MAEPEAVKHACWNCGAAKKTSTGICSNCGRFNRPTTWTEDLDPEDFITDITPPKEKDT